MRPVTAARRSAGRGRAAIRRDCEIDALLTGTRGAEHPRSDVASDMGNQNACIHTRHLRLTFAHMEPDTLTPAPASILEGRSSWT
jgi:hypothetical protein